MKIACPECGQHYEIDADCLGELVQCVCGSSFVAGEYDAPDTDIQAIADSGDDSESTDSFDDPDCGKPPNMYAESSESNSLSPKKQVTIKPLTCEMCGSSEIIKADGVFTCQSCGMKYSVEEARKMMISDSRERMF